MLYQPMTDSQAEDLWVTAYIDFLSTRNPKEEAALFAYMRHIKQEYPGVIPPSYAEKWGSYAPAWDRLLV